MTHHLGQEQMGIVDAARYGTARTQATIAAALADIGSNIAILVLTQSGDGIWTLTSNITIPANVTLWIPPGVTVNRAGGVTLTITGPLISFNPNWLTGTGTIVRNVADGVFTEFTRLVAYSGYNAPFDGVGYVSGVGAERQIILNTRLIGGADGGNNVIRWWMPPQTNSALQAWDVGMNGANEFYIGRPGTFGRLILTNTGLGLSNATGGLSATHLLQLSQDDAFKATTLWSVPSDSRLKTVQRPATEGLAELLALPDPVWFTWNGQGGTDPAAPEQMGWIAQEAVDTAPYLFRTYEDKLEPSDADPTTLYSANYSPVLHMLVNAVKELAAQNEALAARVTALEQLALGIPARVEGLEAAAHGHAGQGSAAGTSPYTAPGAVQVEPGGRHPRRSHGRKE